MGEILEGAAPLEYIKATKPRLVCVELQVLSKAVMILRRERDAKLLSVDNNPYR